MNKGLFIVLEGPDGRENHPGCQQLADWFRLYGREVVTREPGGRRRPKKSGKIVLIRP